MYLFRYQRGLIKLPMEILEKQNNKERNIGKQFGNLIRQYVKVKIISLKNKCYPYFQSLVFKCLERSIYNSVRSMYVNISYTHVIPFCEAVHLVTLKKDCHFIK